MVHGLGGGDKEKSADGKSEKRLSDRVCRFVKRCEKHGIEKRKHDQHAAEVSRGCAEHGVVGVNIGGLCQTDAKERKQAYEDKRNCLNEAHEDIFRFYRIPFRHGEQNGVKGIVLLSCKLKRIENSEADEKRTDKDRIFRYHCHCGKCDKDICKRHCGKSRFLFHKCGYHFTSSFSR